jgi:hypothetical protein
MSDHSTETGSRFEAASRLLGQQLGQPIPDSLLLDRFVRTAGRKPNDQSMAWIAFDRVGDDPKAAPIC